MGGRCQYAAGFAHGTCDEVRADVARRVDVFSRGGGFIFGTVHNIQDDVPAENIIAMFETLGERR